MNQERGVSPYECYGFVGQVGVGREAVPVTDYTRFRYSYMLAPISYAGGVIQLTFTYLITRRWIATIHRAIQ